LAHDEHHGEVRFGQPIDALEVERHVLGNLARLPALVKELLHHHLRGGAELLGFADADDQQFAQHLAQLLDLLLLLFVLQV